MSGPAVHFTRVAKAQRGLLSKRIHLSPDGHPVSDGQHCAMSAGSAQRVRLNGSPATGLATQIDSLGSHEAIILGDLKDGLPDEVDLKLAKRADPARGTHGRTRETFVFRPGQPAPVLLDFDQKGMPADVRGRLAALGGFEAAVASLIPGYADLASVVRASTSAGIYNKETGERFPGSGGIHVYLFCQDGSDIPRFLEALCKRAWLAGFGWIMVAGRGALLRRAIVDSSVGLPERLSFEGPPLVVAPLAQDAAERQPRATEGEYLDTWAACPPLTVAEERRYDELVAAAKRAAKPEAEAAQEEAAEEIAAERGVHMDTARAMVRASNEGNLTALDRLEFDDGASVTVADVLADPGQFHGRTLSDPIEGPSYGRGKARLYWNPDATVIVNSFAHGGIVYKLNHDAAYIEAELRKAGAKAVPFVLARLMVNARGLEASTRERLNNLAAKLAGVSRSAVREDVRESMSKARQTATEAAQAREAEEQAEAEPDDAEADAAHAQAEEEPEAEDDWEAKLEAAVDELNQDYLVASMGGSVRIASTVRDETLGRERLVFSRPEDIKLLYAPRHYVVGITDKGNEIWKGLGEAWINHKNRRTYRQIAMITDGPCPPDTFNLWRGFGVEPQAGAWGTIEGHLREVICSGHKDHYDWLIGWLAHCVQRPGRQAEAAVVLRGLKGTGKGMLGQMLTRIFRDHALHVTHSKHLVGNFNAHLVDALFLFLDEAFWAGDKQGEGTLKALVTERSIMIEPKGVDSFQMPNRLKILMASNNEWVVPASADERRYFVLDVSDRRKGDRAYFGRLAAAIEGDELAAFLDHLLYVDLSGFDHRNPPHTEGLNKQKLIGAESFVRYWHDCLSAGYLLGTGEADWPENIVVELVHAGYVEHAHHHGDRHPLTIEQVGAKLRKLSPDRFKTIRPRAPWNGHDRPLRYALLTLDEHRAAFLAAMNIPAEDHAWPEEGE